jgi:hypothetical protein
MTATGGGRKALVLALVLPILGLVALIVRSEFVAESGTKWILAIHPYDPRDLLRGHYLRYRIDWRWDGAQSCEGGWDECCYCLHGNVAAPPEEPTVEMVSCGAVARCASWFPRRREENLSQFFIPEDREESLTRAIRDRPAHLLISVTSGGGVVIRDMLLDRRPWREVAR